MVIGGWFLPLTSTLLFLVPPAAPCANRRWDVDLPGRRSAEASVVFSTQNTGLWTWGKRWMMSFFFAWHEFLVIFLGWFHHEEMNFIFFAMIWSFFEIRGMEGGNFQLGSSGSTRSKNTLNPNLLRLLLLNHGRTLPNAGKHSVGTGYPHLHFILLVGWIPTDSDNPPYPR